MAFFDKTGFVGGISSLFGGEDPVGGKVKNKLFSSQTEINMANNAVKEFAKRRGMAFAEDMYVGRKIGDPVPRYIDSATGMDYAPNPTAKKAYNVPPEIQLSDIKTDGNAYWYADPQTGDLVNVDYSVLNLPRFRNQNQEIARELALRRSTASK